MKISQVTVKATLNKHFRKDSELMLLACESDAMGDCLRWEPARGGDMFPHLYRDLLLSDVIWTRLILPGTWQDLRSQGQRKK